MSEVADPPREPVPDRGIDRLVGFSDAVLAIAITLVALPLVDSAQALGTEPVAALFQHNSWALLSAASSFFAITLIWIGHNRLFERRTGHAGSAALDQQRLAGRRGRPAAHHRPERRIERRDLLGLSAYLANLAVIIALSRIEAMILDTKGPRTGSARKSARQVVIEWMPTGVLTLTTIGAASVGRVALWLLLVLPASLVVKRILARTPRVRSRRSDPSTAQRGADVG